MVNLSQIFDDAPRWVGWSQHNPEPFDRRLGAGSAKGRGEHRYAWEVGGTVASGRIDDYDVFEEDGLTEVKEVHSKSRTVRVGNKGSSSGHRFAHWVRCIADDLRNVRDETVQEFLRQKEERILVGELAKGLIFGETRENPIGLLQIIEMVSGIANPYLRMPADEMFSELVLVPTADVISLHDSVFTDPSLLIREWNAIRASDVFGHVVRMVFVNERLGYMRVPRESLDVVLRLANISQGGKLRFNFMGKFGPDKRQKRSRH